MTVNSRFERIASYGMIVVFSAVALYPVLTILLLALHRQTDLVTGFAWPHRITFSSFKTAWVDGNFATGYKSSALVAAAVTLISASVSVLAGYALGTMRFPGQAAFFGLMVLGIVFPYEATVIPLYYDFQSIHPFGINVSQGYWALILPQVGTSVAFGVVWMRSFFRGAPRSLIEAARIDGASTFGVLYRILLPQARPAILTMCALVFMWTWNEFLLALVMVSDENLRTAPLGLAFFSGRNTTDFALLAAGSVIVATPVVLVYVFLQRHFIRGMLSGAVKG